jgi:hypothetical protein
MVLPRARFLVAVRSASTDSNEKLLRASNALIKEIFAGILCSPLGHDWATAMTVRVQLDNRIAICSANGAAAETDTQHRGC